MAPSHGAMPTEVIVVDGPAASRGTVIMALGAGGSLFVGVALGLGVSPLAALPFLLPLLFFSAITLAHLRTRTRIVADTRGLRGQSVTLWGVPQKLDVSWSDLMAVRSEPTAPSASAESDLEIPPQSRAEPPLQLVTRHRYIQLRVAGVTLAPRVIHQRLARIVENGPQGATPSTEELERQVGKVKSPIALNAAVRADSAGLHLKNPARVIPWNKVVAAHIAEVPNSRKTIYLELSDGQFVDLGAQYAMPLSQVAELVAPKQHDRSDYIPPLEQPNVSALLLSLAPAK